MPKLTDKATLQLANKVLVLAYELNDYPVVDGGPCRLAFELARQIIDSHFPVENGSIGM